MPYADPAKRAEHSKQYQQRLRDVAQASGGLGNGTVKGLRRGRPVIVWTDPDEDERPNRWFPAFKQLMEHPNRWAVVYVHSQAYRVHGVAGNLRAGAVRLPAPHAEFEVTSRKLKSDLWAIYVRYIGAAESEAAA